MRFADFRYCYMAAYKRLLSALLLALVMGAVDSVSAAPTKAQAASGSVPPASAGRAAVREGQ